MKLSIIVTHYDEPGFICAPLFDSIRRQEGIEFLDLEVLIVNDGKTRTLTNNFIDYYRKYFRVRYISKAREGISAARNYGLQRAFGDYVMFCDCDDCFFSVGALFQIFSEIETGFDYLDSPFFETGIDEREKPFFYRHENDSTFIHGKVYRRGFLLDNGLAFERSLPVNEDSNFILRVRLFADRFGLHKYIPEPFYLWRYRSSSVCRTPGHEANTYQYFVEGQDLAISWLMKRNLNNIYGGEISGLIYACYLRTYFLCHSLEFLDSENLFAVETRFVDFYDKYKNFVNSNLHRAKSDEIYLSETATAAKRGVYAALLPENFSTWIARIKADARRGTDRRRGKNDGDR